MKANKLAVCSLFQKFSVELGHIKPSFLFADTTLVARPGQQQINFRMSYIRKYFGLAILIEYLFICSLAEGSIRNLTK